MNSTQLKQKKGAGTLFGALAFIIWGVAPLYWRLLSRFLPEVILSHRIIWCFVFLTVFMGITGRWRAWVTLIRERKSRLFFVAGAVLLGSNWFIYMWAIANDMVVDASMGYFINPLFVIFLGIVVFKERLGLLKLLALVFAAAGVVVLAVSYGRLPWVALSLTVTFGLYGMIKKLSGADPYIGLHVESGFLVPVAVGYLLLNGVEGGLFGPSKGLAALLVGAGALTILPLTLFAQSTQMIQYTQVGFLQYIAPSLTLIIGVFVFGEEFTAVHGVSFGLIWLALVLSSIAQVIGMRKKKDLQNGQNSLAGEL